MQTFSTKPIEVLHNLILSNLSALRLSFFLLITLFFLSSCSKKQENNGTPRILVFSKTEGYRHASIPDGIAAIQKLGAENGFIVDTTENATNFTEDSLKKYAAVIFLSTTGDVLTRRQEVDFERYIQSGGGFVGIHSATDTEYDWEWFNQLVGAQFADHPEIQEADLHIHNHKHLATKHLDKKWHRKDEWYNFKNYNKNVKVLMTIDENSYKGGTMQGNHPMSWHHVFDGGNAFYTALGHTTESYSEPAFLQHLLGGIKYAMGKNKRNLKNATSERVPEEDRFTKTLLADGLNEPTEMAVLPNGDVLLLERRGNVKLYSQATKKVTIAAQFNAYFKTGIENVNAEEGMLGITIDPKFKDNKWVYIFYSPLDTSVNRLSRFKFENNQIQMQTEQKILEFYSQREICCHTGGSLAFGPDGLLYLSTGDNSTPFDEANQPFVNHGFGPADDRLGHEQYDARRTSANTNDLRGKVLRIKINENGGYSIPQGNLFAEGTPKTRPEIYTMGLRNPYRLSIDAKRNILFWGEVGPDAAKDSMDTRGPRGYDEVNMARKAGNYGWPLFVGKSYPYRAYDYATGKSGAPYNPEKPINNSRNNTGLQELPPTNPAYIWYPYGKSKEFPMLGSGSRNAMAGPIYYSEKYPKATRLPEYYDGKLLIYDWMRAWIFAVTMDKDGNYKYMEPFAPNIKMACPIDMEMGPDGKIYILDYGKGWFTSNAETSLYTIEFNHQNLPPKPVEIYANKTGGKAPVPIQLTAIGGKDPEEKPLTYRWNFGYGNYKETKMPKIDYTFPVDGTYSVNLEVIDEKGAISKSNSLNINVGNDIPKVQVALAGNSQFYFPEAPPSYSVSMNDAEDGNVIDVRNLMIKSNYLDSPDKAAMGHQQTIVQSGKTVMEGSDCQSCHKINDKSIGPSFLAVALRYPNTPANVGYLVKKILNGGGGVWGETAMAAHPGLTGSDAGHIVNWILGLGNTKPAEKSLPTQGRVALPKELKDKGLLVLSASYIDKGEKPQTGSAFIELRHPVLEGTEADQLKYCSRIEYEEQQLVAFDDNNQGFLAYKNLDLTNVRAIDLTYGVPFNSPDDMIAEIYLDSPNGQLIGTQKFGKNVVPVQFQNQRISIKPVMDKQKHTLYIVLRKNSPQTTAVYLSKFLLKAL